MACCNFLTGGKRKGLTLGPLQKCPKGLLGSEHDTVADSYESGNELTVPKHAIRMTFSLSRWKLLSAERWLRKQQWKLRYFLCIRVVLFCAHSSLICSVTCRSVVVQLVTSFSATYNHSVVLQLSFIQSFCNLSLSCCATCCSVVVQLVTTQFLCNLSPVFLQLITTQLFANYHHSFVLQLITTLQLVTIQSFCNLSLNCWATCRSVVVQLVTTQLLCNLSPVFLQLITTQLFCNLSPFSRSVTCHSLAAQLVSRFFAPGHYSVVPQLITTHLFWNSSPFICSATCHHSDVLHIVTQLVRNL